MEKKIKESVDQKQLYKMAKEVLKYSYAPYSKFNVGAALLTADGEIYTGVNIENSSYGAAICAERVAMTKAISEGKKEFVAIAVACSRDVAWPCGICRQFMYEFAPNLVVIAGADEDTLKSYLLKELLIEGFML